MMFLKVVDWLKKSLSARLKQEKYSIKRLEEFEKKLVRNIIHKISGKEIQALLTHIATSKEEINNGYHYTGKLSVFMAKSLGIGYRRACFLVKFLENENLLCYRCHQDVGGVIEISINNFKVAKYC